MPTRIAMWSGPRNVSTALMRSWGSRLDTAVVDEPLYAFYLAATGRDHPGRREVLSSQPTDWREVAAALTGPVPAGRAIFYQKHMAHHLLPVVGREWLDGLRHAFLLREPRAMLASLVRVWPEPDVADTGLRQQVELFRRAADRLGHAPPVIDAGDLLADPPGVLSDLCAALGVPFDPAMLAWEAGPRPEDGVWAPHWYASVNKTTGFEPPRAEGPAEVPARLAGVLAECERLYALLYPYRISAAADEHGPGRSGRGA
jgi:hypothetical protein